MQYALSDYLIHLVILLVKKPTGRRKTMLDSFYSVFDLHFFCELTVTSQCRHLLRIMRTKSDLCTRLPDRIPSGNCLRRWFQLRTLIGPYRKRNYSTPLPPAGRRHLTHVVPVYNPLTQRLVGSLSLSTLLPTRSLLPLLLLYQYLSDAL